MQRGWQAEGLWGGPFIKLWRTASCSLWQTWMSTLWSSICCCSGIWWSGLPGYLLCCWKLWGHDGKVQVFVNWYCYVGMHIRVLKLYKSRGILYWFFMLYRRWVQNSLARPVEMRYNPYTQTIEVIDSVRGMENLVTQMRYELNHLNSAIKHIKMNSGCVWEKTQLSKHMSIFDDGFCCSISL